MKKRILLLLLITFSVATACQSETKITNRPEGNVRAQYNDSPMGEGCNMLIDGLSNTKFLTFHSSAWVVFKSPSAYVLSRYTITSANDAPERDPKSWTLEGSNNGVTFYSLDRKTNQHFSSREETREFKVPNNTKAYVYYRLKVSNQSGSILQFAEWGLRGTKGHLSTKPFADFSINSYLVTQQGISFTNASLNTNACKWTFQGAIPGTSTDQSPTVVYKTPGTYTVKLEASQGTKTVVKTMKIVVNDINNWSSFIYPSVHLSCVNTSNPGYIKYLDLAKMNGFCSIEDFVKNCCLVIAKELYYTVDEANEHGLRNIDYKLNEGGALSYKGGDVPSIEIGFDMNYLNTFSQSHSDAVSADEVYGVLCHELCHGYQRGPLNAGGYELGTEYFGFLEGTADLARLQTGGFNPKRFPKIGGHWTHGYNTTGFFYQWLANTHSATFLKDLNRTALTINPWTVDAACKQLLGESVVNLWNTYQSLIPNLKLENGKPNRITIALNEDMSTVSVHNLAINKRVRVINNNGHVDVEMLKTTEGILVIDIHKLKTGNYTLIVEGMPQNNEIKFVKP